MAAFHLRPHDRQALARIASPASTTKELLRSPALQWLDQGETVEQVAHRLLISRQGEGQLARTHLSMAREAIKVMSSYHRNDQELAELEQILRMAS